MKKDPAVYIVCVVLVVAVIGIFSLFLDSSSNIDLSGQATKITKVTDSTKPVLSIKATCTEDDGGDVEGTPGTTKKGSSSQVDTCADSATLREYYCNSADMIGSKSVSCSSGYCTTLSVGSTTGGACVTGCYDSDTGTSSKKVSTDSYKTKGTTTSSGTAQTDACSSDADTITEYYCYDSSTAKSEGKKCSELFGADYVCSDGACVEDVCSDTESPTDAEVQGTVTTLGGESQVDVCSPDEHTVYEFECSDATTASESTVEYSTYSGTAITITGYDCADDGKVCSAGACVTLDTPCTEDDGGEVSTEKGTTTGYLYMSISTSSTISIADYDYTMLPVNDYEDECDGEDYLTEYYCDDYGFVKDIEIECEDVDLLVCSDGACVECVENSDCGYAYNCNTATNTCYDYCGSGGSGADQCQSGYTCTDDVTKSKGCFMSCTEDTDCTDIHRQDCDDGWCV